jgi:hypothetical protein
LSPRWQQQTGCEAGDRGTLELADGYGQRFL